jgi:hypothetical protein
MYLDRDKITEIFVLADEFCIGFNETVHKHTLGKKPKKKPKMSQSEVITIMVLFHYGAFKNMKHFYEYFVKQHLTREFPQTVSYNRFVELMQSAALPMTLFLKTCCLGACTGISFVDSTPIRVCKNKRIPRHKVFDGIAKRGKSTMGYFFGFKLHYVINDKGEILSFVITPGNIDDREPLKDKAFIEKLRGKLYADKGYISEKLTEILFVDGLHLITQIRNGFGITGFNGYFEYRFAVYKPFLGGKRHWWTTVHLRRSFNHVILFVGRNANNVAIVFYPNEQTSSCGIGKCRNGAGNLFRVVNSKLKVELFVLALPDEVCQIFSG